jgi:hypothetical protein
MTVNGTDLAESSSESSSGCEVGQSNPAGSGHGSSSE